MIRPNRRAVTLVLAVGLPCVTAFAQVFGGDPIAPRTRLSPQDFPTTGTGVAFCGVLEAEGRLLAVGPDYRARFDDGFEFTPALGEHAPRAVSLSVKLASIGRRDGSSESSLRTTELGATTTRTSQDRGELDRVEFVHGDHLVERYEVRPDGVEQSFVFAALPPGRGELVVRLDVATSLVASHRNQLVRELTFAEEGVGGVHVGAVTGIDARGRRTDGAMRFAGGTLELTLPGAFVADATLPLVLDPLFGTRTVVQQATMRHVDSAYDETHDEYLLVWEQVVSSSNSDIFARRLGSDGATRGAVLAVRSTSSRRSRSPRVANVAARDAFVLVWHETPTAGTTNWDVLARRVNAGSSGGLSSTITVAGGVGTQVDPDVGGSSGTQNRAQVVWDNIGALWVASLVLDTGTGIGLLGLGPVAPVAVHNPRISSHGGDADRHLVVWRQHFLCSSGPCRILAMLIDRDRAPIGPAIVVHERYARFADVDGDGERWLAVFELDATLGSVGTRWNIACRVLEYDVQSGGLRLGIGRAITSGSGYDERSPSVTQLRGEAEYLVGYLGQVDSTSTSEATVATVDPINCRVCETDTMTFTSGSATSVTVTAGGVDGEGLLATIRGTQLFAQPFRSENGIVTDLGGGCGLGGTARVFCARVGNSWFEHYVLDAQGNRPAWLLLSSGRFDRRIQGFACDIVPNPFVGFVLSGGQTDATGRTSVRLVIPSVPELAGLRLVEQWIVGTELSNALRFEIQ